MQDSFYFENGRVWSKFVDEAAVLLQWSLRSDALVVAEDIKLVYDPAFYTQEQYLKNVRKIVIQ